MGLMRPGSWDAGAADKGSAWARHGGAASHGMRTCAALALLVAAALLVVGLQWEPGYSSIVHQLRTAEGSEPSHWVPGSRGRGSGAYRTSLRSAPSDGQVQGILPTQGERLLSFEACGDPAVQRIALLSGLVLAAELNRTAVLPRLLLDGSAAEFGSVYNVDHFVAELRRQGVQLMARSPDGAQPMQLELGGHYDALAALQRTYAGVQHISTSCPAFRLPPDLFVKHERLAFAAIKALQLGPLLDFLLRAQQHMQRQSADGLYNVLYLHAEQDWVQQCVRWERIGPGARLDNCMNNTRTVGMSLRVHNVDTQVPLLVLTGQGSVDEELLGSAVASLQNEGYKVVGWGDLSGITGTLTRDAAALVQYYLALGAHQFAGNSVAVPDALLIMERWNAGLYATYYNGGNIPLEAHIPLFPMPWVFTYNDWSAGTEYDWMVQAAVTSAIEVGRVKPHCMFTGSTESPMYRWLASKDITLILHTPEWKEALIRESMTGDVNIQARKRQSHLYKSTGAIVGAYLRIDIPKLPHFDQYNYVLFTDCDVYFRKHMKLIDWGTPLPAAIGMGYERYDWFPYNNGVMLWNMPYMKKTNAAFVDWILNQHNGLYYGRYTAVDQGAFNQYYEQEVKGKPISRKFNAMIYLEFRDDARIVHLHGPKMNHYLEYLRTGNCQFGDLCTWGIYKGGLCKYAAEYLRYVPEWQVVHHVHRLCTNLMAGSWHPPHKNVPKNTCDA
ncbi:hypothetical protein COHA_000462 [Chlorella ohadii]|uniref:Uncharacterized protein n=1 Tax=Chlorella ohadii TaxID=2649997 RepID=A0AAD5H6N9_9CHLO|nr:hypothetical protein COHA_000462 [Chlorella ohadii]